MTKMSSTVGTSELLVQRLIVVKGQSRGLVVVCAPVKQRLSLVALTTRAAALPIISRGLASRLSGCWNSVLMYRRCLVPTVNDI